MFNYLYFNTKLIFNFLFYLLNLCSNTKNKAKIRETDATTEIINITKPNTIKEILPNLSYESLYEKQEFYYNNVSLFILASSILVLSTLNHNQSSYILTLTNFKSATSSLHIYWSFLFSPIILDNILILSFHLQWTLALLILVLIRKLIIQLECKKSNGGLIQRNLKFRILHEIMLMHNF